MESKDCATRIAMALGVEKPAATLLVLARSLRDEGMSQDDMLSIFDHFRAIHHNDADETRYDAILDTMDYIVGWGTIHLFEKPTK